MKINLKLVIALICSALAANSAFAGGCKLDEVTPEKYEVAMELAFKTREKVLQLEEAIKLQGKKIDVVVIARMGESLDQFKTFESNMQKSLPSYLEELFHGELNKLPFSKDRLAYSHMGFLVRRNDRHAPDVADWTQMIHLLAHCDEKSKKYGQSEIFFEGHDKFYWDTEILDKSENKNKTLIMVPSEQIQSRILNMLNNNAIFDQGLHTYKYNVIATPFKIPKPENKPRKQDPQFAPQLNDQNSNQWPLEMMAAAADRSANNKMTRESAQKFLWETNYHPSLVYSNTKLGAGCRAANANIMGLKVIANCEDQTYRWTIGQVFKGGQRSVYQVITVESVKAYLEKQNLMAIDPIFKDRPAVYEIMLPRAQIDEIVLGVEIAKRIDKLGEKK